MELKIPSRSKTALYELRLWVRSKPAYF